MAELIEAIVAVCEVILEALLYILAVSITIIAYAISPRFRERKRSEWANKPNRKYFEFGISAFCLMSVIAAATWFAFLRPQRAITPENVRIERGTADEDLRLNVKPGTVQGITNDVAVAVKKGGTKKILDSGSLGELGKVVRENVAVIQQGSPTNSKTTTNSSRPTAGR